MMSSSQVESLVLFVDFFVFYLEKGASKVASVCVLE